MTYECTKERFLSDVKDHSMEVVRDDGLHRHITFTNNGSQVYRFDLITWPGTLCITGNCGTYVFKRMPDMFEFFRTHYDYIERNDQNALRINAPYWGEKLQSIDVHGYKEFDPDRFRERVTEHFNGFWEGCEDNELKLECWQEIEESVLSRADDGEFFAYQAVYDFHFKTDTEYRDFVFTDFFDSGGTERFTFRYIWCLYAIVYGIAEYDKFKQQTAAA